MVPSSESGRKDPWSVCSEHEHDHDLDELRIYINILIKLFITEKIINFV